MNRRTFATRATALVVAIGSGMVGQAQRVSQSVGGVLSYTLSEGQTTFTLLTRDGTFLRPDQVERVLGDFRAGAVADLLPEQYTLEQGELHVVASVAEWLDGLTVLHH